MFNKKQMEFLVNEISERWQPKTEKMTAIMESVNYDYIEDWILANERAVYDITSYIFADELYLEDVKDQNADITRKNIAGDI